MWYKYKKGLEKIYERKRKNKKIIFSEEIDSSINGFALVVAFIIIGIFLLFNKDYFGNEIVVSIIQWIFIVIGCLGFATEISNINSKREIKGLDDLVLGVVIVGIWAGIYYFFKHWIGNTIGFMFLIFGLFGGVRGIIEICYSIFRIKNKNNKEKKHNMSIVKDIILILSEIAGMVLIIIQILQAIKII